MQGVQSGSRSRGIGRYTLALTNALIRTNSCNEIILLFNGLFPDSIEWARSYFAGKLPQENIRVWTTTGPVDYFNDRNSLNRKVSELIREASILSLNPDIVLISSLFEGTTENVVTSINKFTHDLRTAAIVYDLIPLIHQDNYLPDARTKKWYMEKVAYIEKADILLAISESSREEALSNLRITPHKITNISSAVDEIFFNNVTDVKLIKDTHVKFGIIKPFVFYFGGSDIRKNLPRLISVYAKLPKIIRDNHQLVIAGAIPQGDEIILKEHAGKIGLRGTEILFFSFINDSQLIALYQSCKCFVFPSWHEGFGLPVLEAMSCGAPVIASNMTSIPEIICNQEALFNPFDDQSIYEKIHKVLTNDDFRQKLIEHGLRQCKYFSWDLTAERTFSAFEESIKRVTAKSPTKSYRSNPLNSNEIISRLVRKIVALPNLKKNQQFLLNLAYAIDFSIANDGM